MESFLRWGLLFIAVFVVFLIFYDVWFRRANRSQEKEELLSKDPVTEPFIVSEQQFNQFEQDTLSAFDEIKISDEGDSSKLHQIKDHEPVPMADDIVIISVLAKANSYFASYDLLQAISATGMQFGDMDIFHYYQLTDAGHIKLFSLASATKPGKFDLNRMGDFYCVGLSLFMNKRAVPHPEKTFLTMLEKAEQLADDLDGELRAGPLREPWNEKVLQRYLSMLAFSENVFPL
jgi:cell division protein ZipA